MVPGPAILKKLSAKAPTIHTTHLLSLFSPWSNRRGDRIGKGERQRSPSSGEASPRRRTSSLRSGRMASEA
jgi:hypothetical protein